MELFPTIKPQRCPVEMKNALVKTNNHLNPLIIIWCENISKRIEHFYKQTHKTFWKIIFNYEYIDLICLKYTKRKNKHQKTINRKTKQRLPKLWRGTTPDALGFQLPDVFNINNICLKKKHIKVLIFHKYSIV